MFGEVLHQHALIVRAGAAIPVRLAGVDEEVEALVGLDQRVREPDRTTRVHVVVEIPGGKSKVALEVAGEFVVGGHADVELDLVGVRGILHHFTRVCVRSRVRARPATARRTGATGPHRTGSAIGLGNDLHAVVPLTPVLVVDVVVVIAGFRPAHLEEVVVRREQHGGGRHEATTRVAEDADLVEVDELVACAELLDGVLLIGQRIIAHVAVAVAMIGERAERTAATMADFDHDEAELRELHERAAHTEAGGRAFGLRAGIHVRDDRILFRAVEVERLPHVAVQLRDAVGGLHRERLGVLEAELLQLGQVHFLERAEDAARGAVAQHRLEGQIHARERVVDVALRGRDDARRAVLAERGRMVRVAGVEQGEAAAVAIYAIQVRLVELFTGLTTLARHPYLLRRGIDRDDAVGIPLSGGERTLLAAVETIHVEHAPAGLLRPPEEIATLLQIGDILRLERGAFDGIGEQRLDGAGGHVHFDEVDGALRTIATHEAHFVTVHGPMYIHQ